MNRSAISRRTALKSFAATGLAAPFVFRKHVTAAPSETVYHASFGAAGQAGSDILALAASKHLKLVAVAEVDLARVGAIKKRFPDCKIYQDWRELLDKEKNLTSVNVSTPDHMHAPITMRALRQGLNVYTQKPLTQTLYEARQLTLAAAARKNLVTQLGTQIHSHEVHRTVVATVQAGAIGKVKTVHSWSGKDWGDRNPRPDRTDPVPATLNWDSWIGVASERPFIKGYYHPSVWRKRLDFGTGTFGDMGCHILDPVFTSLALTKPTSVRSETDEAPNQDSWALNARVVYRFPTTAYTTDGFALHWYNGDNRPPADVQALIGAHKLNDQGSIYIGTGGVLYSPYIAMPVLLPADKFHDYQLHNPGGVDHYLQFVEACRGNGKTTTPFSYSGPLTESVLLGCLATRFPQQTLGWDADNLHVKNVKEANSYVRRTYRKGWEVEGL
jgi:predicted dehydrogenase